MKPTKKRKKRRGFASMKPELQRAIAAKGGAAVVPEKRSFSQDRELARTAGRKGGLNSGGNFARDPARAAEAGRKGGLAFAAKHAKDGAKPTGLR